MTTLVSGPMVSAGNGKSGQQNRELAHSAAGQGG